jgi:hypothetical protein
LRAVYFISLFVNHLDDAVVARHERGGLMSRRNVLNEVKEKKSRSLGRGFRGFYELEQLYWTFNLRSTGQDGMNSLCVIGIAACIEACVRDVIKHLVDYGEPYLSRISRFKDLLRFDLELTKALSTSEITFGELVAHLLPISKVSDIASHLEMILNDEEREASFKTRLSNLREIGASVVNSVRESDSPENSVLGRRIVDDADHLMAEISELFKLRHIAAHEADFSKVTGEQVISFLSCAKSFMRATFEMAKQELDPEVALSSFGSSFYAIRKSNETLHDLFEEKNKTLREIAAGGEDGFSAIGLFFRAESAFNDYLVSEIAFRTSYYFGHSDDAERKTCAETVWQLSDQRLQGLKKSKIEIQALVQFMFEAGAQRIFHYLT